MNGAWVHLAFNHIPVVALPFCFLQLLVGLIRKSKDLVQASYVGFILIALLTVPALKSGGPAARMIHALPGIERVRIHEHAEAAENAFWGVVVLGVLGFVGLLMGQEFTSAQKALGYLTLVIALVISVGMAKVAHLGGLIRHPEIASDFAPPSQPSMPPPAPSNPS